MALSRDAQATAVEGAPAGGSGLGGSRLDRFGLKRDACVEDRLAVVADSTGYHGGAAGRVVAHGLDEALQGAALKRGFDDAARRRTDRERQLSVLRARRADRRYGVEWKSLDVDHNADLHGASMDDRVWSGGRLSSIRAGRL